ncbi:hypothetical protein [Streptomyces collinus]|uniref:hypothetical protein n=1 Tax=Streptomyces collinus TaxID=42684 RepID=UPI003419DA7D
MSTERDQGAGASGAHGAGGEPGVVPNVYHPRNAPAPSYDEYADPATAHGWQNAYDETRELPPVRMPMDGPGPEPVPVPPVAHEPAGGPGRADLRRRRRRGGRRRVAVVAGVLGTAGAVAVIAALTGSGSPGGRQHPASEGRVSPDAASARPKSGSPAATTGGPGVVSAPPVASTPGSAPATTAPAGGPTRTATTPPGTPGGSPSTAASASPEPTLTGTPTASWTAGHPGHGHGHGGGRKPGDVRN